MIKEAGMVFIMDEKRRFPRVRLQSPLRYQILGRPEARSAVTSNISLGGVGFTDSSFIPPLSTLQLEIGFLSCMVSARGRVAWAAPLPHSDRYRLGIEFTGLAEKDKECLADYIGLQMAEA